MAPKESMLDTGVARGGGGTVTTPVWHPKIWANFSLFALHFIMAYSFKLLILNKATLGNLKQRNQNPS